MIEKCKIRVITGEPDGSYFFDRPSGFGRLFREPDDQSPPFEFGHGYDFRITNVYYTTSFFASVWLVLALIPGLA